MRHALLSTLVWLAALQSWNPFSAGLESVARLLAIASVLGTLTVLVYRLGVWRQEMENAKHNIAAETRQHRDESAANFGRIERRLDAIDQSLSILADERARTTRWRARMNRRLERLARVERAEQSNPVLKGVTQ